MAHFEREYEKGVSTTMTVSEYANRNLPENYYPMMHLDGYTPEEILMSAHRTLFQKAEGFQEEEGYENVHITSEVKVKK